MAEDTGTDLTFFGMVNAAHRGELDAQYEEGDLERFVDRLLNKANVMRDLPMKYCRALTAYCDMRMLLLQTMLATADNGGNVARIQGRIQEMTMLRAIAQTILGEQKEENHVG